MTYDFQIVGSLSDINKAQWNAFCPQDNPFLEYDFLNTLERSQCVGSIESGWVPQHIVIQDQKEVVGFFPLYEKYDSYGEYIFDWGWAHAARSAGIEYYPKLVSAIPFTPVTGTRVLCAPEHKAAVTEALRGFLLQHMTTKNYSSAHILFCTQEEQTLWANEQFMPRMSHQFHWKNKPWATYSDFLKDLRSPARKQIRKEREFVYSKCDKIIMKTGEEIDAKEWSCIQELYLQTIGEKGAIPYLTRSFFKIIKDIFAHRIACSFAYLHGKVIAGALFYYTDNRLFGRYWGSFYDVPFLHFELCYYKPIEWCIEKGIKHFEAGAQGIHKLKRGLQATNCYSAHYIVHSALAEGVNRFIEHEKSLLEKDLKQLNKHGPFKQQK
tara:strand:- start:421 stop:1563 length:1143 start_codon:yes stop_codon:yes gene_type:complete